MSLRNVKLKQLTEEDRKIIDRLFEVATKCLRWGEHGETMLGFKSSKIRQGTLFLRLIAKNRYFAICPSDHHIYLADMDLKAIENLSEVDLDDIEAMTTQLEKAVKKTSPVEL